MRRSLMLLVTLTITVLVSSPAQGEDLLHVRFFGLDDNTSCGNLPSGWSAVGLMTEALGRLESWNGITLANITAGIDHTDGYLAQNWEGHCFGFAQYIHQPTVLRVYRNSDNHYDYLDPSSFVDGVVLLEGIIGEFEVQQWFSCDSGLRITMMAPVALTGGTRLGLFAENERLLELSGSIDIESLLARATCLETDFFGLLELDLTLPQQTPVQSSTWSRLKRIARP